MELEPYSLGMGRNVLVGSIDGVSSVGDYGVGHDGDRDGHGPDGDGDGIRRDEDNVLYDVSCYCHTKTKTNGFRLVKWY